MSDKPIMRRFTKEQLIELNSRMRTWATLNEFAQMINEVQAAAGFYAVSQGGLKIWREAWVAISCGQLSHALRVKLGDDPPDFELDYGDHQRRFEIVDVMPTGRKLGQTYDYYAEQWNDDASILLERVGGEAEHNALPGDLERQLQAKAAKAYGRPQRRLKWLTEKRRVLCDKPEDPRLTALLDATPNQALTIAYNRYGDRYQERALNQAVTRIVLKLAKQGLARSELTIHGLRHARGVELALAGASDSEIMSQLEQTSTRSAEIYRRQASRRSMADSGQTKIEEAIRLRASHAPKKK